MKNTFAKVPGLKNEKKEEKKTLIFHSSSQQMSFSNKNLVTYTLPIKLMLCFFQFYYWTRNNRFRRGNQKRDLNKSQAVVHHRTTKGGGDGDQR